MPQLAPTPPLQQPNCRRWPHAAAAAAELPPLAPRRRCSSRTDAAGPTPPLRQQNCRRLPPRRRCSSRAAAAGPLPAHAAAVAVNLVPLVPTQPLLQPTCRCGPLPGYCSCSPVAAGTSPHTDPGHHPWRNCRCTTWLNGTTCSSQRQAVNMQYPQYEATVCSHVLSQLRSEYR